MDEMDAVSSPSKQPTAEQEHQRRLRALSQLVRSHVNEEPTPRLSPSAPPASAKRRWAVATALALVLVLVGGGVGYALTRRAAAPTTTPAPSVVSLSLTSAGASCPVAAAWSPDGSRLAVLARQGTVGCDAPGAPAPVVLVYDARRGRLVTRIDPTRVLARVHAAVDVVGDMPLGWSPDGTLLALPASVLTADTPGAPTRPALLLLPLSGDARVLQGQAPGTTAPVVWDVRAGTVANVLLAPLAPALRYRWTGDGHVIPDQPLPPVTDGAAFSGSPTSGTAGATFSLWQAGAIVPIFPPSATPLPSDATGSSAVDYYGAQAALWSPDGRYVIPALTLAGPFPAAPSALERLTMTPDRCASHGLPPCTSSLLPYADRALAEVVGKLAAATGTERDVAVPIAWSADGRLLATGLPQDGLDGRTGRLGITVLNTATGEIIHRFTVDYSGGGDLLPQLSPVLAWSPKAPRLAFMDAVSGHITIWSGIAAPH
jgi:hypothetical protein